MTKPKHITDEQLLEWILDGSLVVTGFDNPTPVVVFRGSILAQTWHLCGGKGRTPGNKRPAYRICNGYQDKTRIRRSISENRLVWMAYHKRLIPDQHDIHHGPDEDRWNNSIGNLNCLHSEEHLAHHYAKPL